MNPFGNIGGVTAAYPLVLADNHIGIMRDKHGLRSLLWSAPGPLPVDKLPGLKILNGNIRVCPLTAEVASCVRKFGNAPRATLPPETGFSFGGGDRLRGFGTRAHIRSLEKFPEAFPILAQQSVRENSRIGRSAQSVMDDTLWAVIEREWNRPWGADADHQKTNDDATEFLSAGFTMVTCDPGEHVVNKNDGGKSLDHIDWEGLETTEADFMKDFGKKDTIWLYPHTGTVFTPEDARAALSKYGNAVVHAKRMYRHARRRNRECVFELSVDETDSPTTVKEHFLIQKLCKKLKIKLWSLAPRFVGKFNKGVDYIGDLKEFRANLNDHAVLARWGNYKLSIHSGSDKFSIYEILNEALDGNLHLKTSGTSYLAVMQTLALCRPCLFLEILRMARDIYPEASKSYHVDADIQMISEKRLAEVRPDEYQTIVLGYHGRQILHVAFGQILCQHEEQVFRVLRENESLHDDLLSTHISRHLRPFAREQR